MRRMLSKEVLGMILLVGVIVALLARYGFAHEVECPCDCPRARTPAYDTCEVVILPWITSSLGDDAAGYPVRPYTRIDATWLVYANGMEVPLGIQPAAYFSMLNDGLSFGGAFEYRSYSMAERGPPTISVSSSNSIVGPVLIRVELEKIICGNLNAAQIEVW